MDVTEVAPDPGVVDAREVTEELGVLGVDARGDDPRAEEEDFFPS